MKQVQVLWATDPLAMWREGVGNTAARVGSNRSLPSQIAVSLLLPLLSDYTHDHLSDVRSNSALCGAIGDARPNGLPPLQTGAAGEIGRISC